MAPLHGNEIAARIKMGVCNNAWHAEATVDSLIRRRRRMQTRTQRKGHSETKREGKRCVQQPTPYPEVVGVHNKKPGVRCLKVHNVIVNKAMQRMGPHGADLQVIQS